MIPAFGITIKSSVVKSLSEMPLRWRIQVCLSSIRNNDPSGQRDHKISASFGPEREASTAEDCTAIKRMGDFAYGADKKSAR